MSVEKQKVISRLIKRLEEFYLNDLTDDLKKEYINSLNTNLTDLVNDSQLSLIQEAIANFPIKLMPARQFINLITPKQKQAQVASLNGERGDGKDWARRIIIRSAAGERPSNIALVWAKEVLIKMGEIEKSIV